MMVRTQISLDDDTHRRAKRQAAELGISLSELVRRAVSRELGGGARPPQARIDAIFGLGDSGGSNVARDKDRYLAEATRHEYERKTRRRPSA